jgi:hypothetical protein
LVREVQPPIRMALRDFEGEGGTRWRVWETIPARTEGLEADFRRGWLTFDNGAERRRFAPLPPAWAEMPAERLELLLRVAQPVSSGDASLDGVQAERRVGERRKAERRHGDRRTGRSDAGSSSASARA